MRAERTKTLYRGIAHRMRTVRIILGLSEQQAADEFGIALRTYRRYEEGAAQRFSSPLYWFAEKYGLEAWLLSLRVVTRWFPLARSRRRAATAARSIIGTDRATGPFDRTFRPTAR
jgi:transcriptional regulator with XRE-family HTH domain